MLSATNWKGKPLENYESIVKLISATTTKNGLKIKARVDNKKYKKGIKITDDEFEEINLKFSNKFPKWNYKILPWLGASLNYTPSINNSNEANSEGDYTKHVVTVLCNTSWGL